jgi:hypothetical protein
MLGARRNDRAKRRWGNEMKLLKKLGNPLALVVQGFTLGAALFFATHPGSGQELAELTFAAADAPVQAAALI